MTADDTSNLENPKGRGVNVNDCLWLRPPLCIMYDHDLSSRPECPQIFILSADAGVRATRRRAGGMNVPLATAQNCERDPAQGTRLGWNIYRKGIRCGSTQNDGM